MTKTKVIDGKVYIVGQARLYTDALHLQLLGNFGNRSYGLSANIPLSQLKKVSLASLEKHEAAKSTKLPSLANTSHKYYRVYVRCTKKMVYINAPGKTGFMASAQSVEEICNFFTKQMN